ncbi:pentapeptide repeat-containing protein [Spirillospora sp. NPDC127200]
MDIREIRDRKILLPSDEPELRTPVTWPPSRGDLADLEVVGQDWSRLRLEDRALIGSSLSGVLLAHAHVEDARITNSVLQDCDLASSRWINTRIDRCVLRGCRLTGAYVQRLTLSDVVFERCRVDYATLAGLHAVGAVGFIDCTLRETVIEESRLDDVVFADCTMTDVRFASTRLRNADLRGSRLDTLTGIPCLAGATIGADQVDQLTQAFVVDLQLNVHD